MMRLLRGILALATLLVSVLVVPWMLLSLGHYPTPGEWGWRRLLWAPDDGRILLWLLTLLGWVVWLLFSLSTALDVATLLGRPQVRLPGLRWMQGISGALLVAVLAMLGSQDGAVSGDPTVAAPGIVTVAAADTVTARPVVAPTANPAPEGEPTWMEYTVVRGDDLWTLAETHLGQGTDWRRIVDLNPELLAGDPDHLRPGWVLRLPVPVATPDPSGAPAPEAPLAGVEPAVAEPDPAEAVEVPPAMPGAGARGPEGEEPVHAQDEVDDAGAHRLRLLGGTGATVAVGVTSLLAVRRHRQLVQRPVGTVPLPVSASADRLRSALAATHLPAAAELVGWAVHMVARDALLRGSLPELEWLRAGPAGIEFRWSQRCAAPSTFEEDGSSWRVGLAIVVADREAHADAEPLRPWPTLVTIGTAGEDTYLVDLERHGRVSVHADSAERAGEVLTSHVLELMTSPWAGGARITVVGDDGGLLEIGEHEGVERFATLEQALPVWESRAATQQSLAAVADGQVPLLRLDPDLAEAWAPQVLVLLADITPAQRARLNARFERPIRGPLVLLSEQPGADATLAVDESPLRSRWEPAGLDLDPQRVPATVRDAVVELVRSSAPLALVPAPWWGSHPDSPAPEELPMPDAPRLLLLGPVALEGARGRPPTRAPRQCLEYCAWLLEHPNASSVEMARSLLVAEPTRRSNTSRLRGWLGSDEDGRPYLPEAYSGRIRLDPSVRSDWQEVQIMLGRGVELASDAGLVAILRLVRGAPLADAPPGGWTWAEEMRITASAALRDVAYALAERSLAANDLDRARWAIGRGLVAAPGDETLLRQLLVCESRLGNLPEVERLVFRLNAQARSLGVDLLPETVITMQRVMEGRIRARLLPPDDRAAV